MEGGLYAQPLFWVTIGLAPALFGASLAHLRLPRLRRASVAALVLAPLIVCTAILACAPSGGEPFWPWWLAGMAMLGIPMALWALAALAGYLIMRRTR